MPPTYLSYEPHVYAKMPTEETMHTGAIATTGGTSNASNIACGAALGLVIADPSQDHSGIASKLLRGEYVAECVYMQMGQQGPQYVGYDGIQVLEFSNMQALIAFDSPTDITNTSFSIYLHAAS